MGSVEFENVESCRCASANTVCLATAGSLVNLAKYPASTVQILGAEKALFRCAQSSSLILAMPLCECAEFLHHPCPVHMPSCQEERIGD